MYDRIDISEGIDLNKANKSKDCMLCHYFYFLNIEFVYFKRNAYRIYFWHMSKHKRKGKSKRKTISLMTNSNLIKKKGFL